MLSYFHRHIAHQEEHQSSKLKVTGSTPVMPIIKSEKYIKKVGEYMSEVYMKYSDFLNSITEEVTFELLTDIILKLKYDHESSSIIMSMEDKITDNTELHGSLDLDRLNTLIKTLTIIRNQIKELQKGAT